TDVPDINKKKIGDIKLGSGPVIARGPNINNKIFDALVNTAKKNKIPYQIEGVPRGTGTDANMIQVNKSGVATALISIPNRYMHSPVEIIDLKDVEHTIDLIVEFIAGLNGKENYIPF
ncbi:MAG: M42 family peptidase, partial [Candidatus Omnitrophica bacterium]|nr:M42 family peptidase [Candidatus Omnitrophota bacterium]